MKCAKILLTMMTASLCFKGWALQFQVPKNGNTMVGSIKTVMMQPNQDFFWLARHYDVALDDIKRANQGMQADMTAIDHAAVLPEQYILPDVPHKGIIVNIATKRLYYFPKGKSYLYTFPVGIGRQGWITPVGQYHIDEKIPYPIWIVPDSIMKYREAHGDPVPKIVRPGPDDPLGNFAMRLSDHRYLIHSTNEPDGVGQRSSAGCVRMYPRNVAFLFPMIKVGTPVRIINQPIKIGVFDGQLWLQAYPPFKETADQQSTDNQWINQQLQNYIKKHNLTVKQWNFDLAQQMVQQATGIPAVVATLG